MPPRRSPGKIESGFVALPVELEPDFALFTESALKVFLILRFRTVWQDHVAMPTKVLATIAHLSEESVRKALRWLEDPTQRKGEAQHLPAYIRRETEPEHEHTARKVQTIYINDWKHPNDFMDEQTAKRRRRQQRRTPVEGEPAS